MALVTCKIFAVEFHRRHKAMKVRQAEPSSRKKQVFIAKPKIIMRAVGIETIRSVEIDGFEAMEIIFELHHCDRGKVNRDDSAF